ncbi:MAG: UbiA family prenyltransferase [Candidatus Micrarchaeia archaeon]|jgi:geranylgeranylglycerol-phosphate geranylgeranyltransferase
MYSKPMAILKLTRVEHSLMLVIAVVAAELISKGLPDLFLLAMSIITPVFISMASFAINDYYDIEVDKYNKKFNRPLVNGSLKPSDALVVTAITLVVGIGASAFINVYCFAIALVFGLLAVFYAYKLKEKLFWGNAYIAFSMAIPFIFGNYVVEPHLNEKIILITFLIFFTGLAREIHGTIRDLKGDTAVRNAKTLPKVIGVKGAAIVSLILYLAAISISILLFLYYPPFKLNLVYIIPTAITDFMLAYVGIAYTYKSDEKFYSFARNASLGAMALALIALLLAPMLNLQI